MKELIEQWEARRDQYRRASQKHYASDLTNKIAIALVYQLDQCIKELKNATENNT